MTRKAVTRARRDAAGNRRKSMPRAATRTGKKTASARAPVQAVLNPATPMTPARKPGAPRRRPAAARQPVMPHPHTDADLGRDARLGAATKEAAAPRTEDDDDLDWLTEEDDPRKQIVEDTEEWDAHHDEW